MKLPQHKQRAAIHSTHKTVAGFYKIKVADMYSKKRQASNRAATPDGDVHGERL